MRGDERPDGVPPRFNPGTMAFGSVLGMCVPGSSSVVSPFRPGSKGGKGSKEGPGAGAPPSAKPLVSASRRFSGEGSTCRMVERVLYAVPGRSGEAGAVRGRMCVALILALSSVGGSGSG